MTTGSVLQVQHQQRRMASSAGDAATRASAVLQVVLQQWGTLLQERLHAIQMMLPDIPLAGPAQSQEQIDSMQAAGTDCENCRTTTTNNNRGLSDTPPLLTVQALVMALHGSR